MQCHTTTGSNGNTITGNPADDQGAQTSTWSTKHHRQSSPGSYVRITG
jgi:hypothetical protein